MTIEQTDKDDPPKARQRVVKVRRDYNTWVANENLEDYAQQMIQGMSGGDYQVIKLAVQGEVKSYFRPEFINRIDEDSCRPTYMDVRRASRCGRCGSSSAVQTKESGRSGARGEPTAGLAIQRTHAIEWPMSPLAEQETIDHLGLNPTYQLFWRKASIPHNSRFLIYVT